MTFSRCAINDQWWGGGVSLCCIELHDGPTCSCVGQSPRREVGILNASHAHPRCIFSPICRHEHVDATESRWFSCTGINKVLCVKEEG